MFMLSSGGVRVKVVVLGMRSSVNMMKASRMDEPS